MSTQIPMENDTAVEMSLATGGAVASGDLEAGAEVKVPPVLDFVNVSHTVDVGVDGVSEMRNILDNVNGTLKPGQMLAILGPSGAGKTTLLNVLAGRVKPTEGSVLLNGSEMDKQSKRIMSYVLQDDILYDKLTVEETLNFTADLRLPRTMSLSDRRKQVDDLIESLQLGKVRKSMVGSSGVRGLSGGERKRVNVANEMITDPSILFLDEPTSGLDSTSAVKLVEMCKRFARERIVVCSIHQPSSHIFHQFDRILLLCDGAVVYHGATSNVVDHFAKAGYPVPPNFNPADHILDLVSTNDPEIRRKLTDAYKLTQEQSEGGEMTTVPLEDSKSFSKVEEERQVFPRWPTSFRQQFAVLARRAFKLKRGDTSTRMFMTEVVLVACMISALWFQLESTASTLEERAGFVFFVLSFWMFAPCFHVLAAFLFSERQVLIKERRSGTFRLSAYFLSKSLAGLPRLLLYPTVFIPITYFAVGLRGEVGAFIAFYLVVLMQTMIAESIGLAVSAWFSEISKALVAAAVLLLTYMLIAGFYIRESMLPNVVSWFGYLSPIRYSYRLAMLIELAGRSFEVKSELDLARWEGVSSITGEKFLENRELASNAAVDAVILVAMFLGLQLVAYIGLRVTTR